MKTLYPMPVLLLASLSSWAQSGPRDFVVNANGDTLRGEFRRTITRQVRANEILLYNGKTARRFATAEVTSLGDAYGQVLVSRPVGASGRHVFLRPMVTGYVSLYSGDNAAGLARFYLQPADSAHVVAVEPATAQLLFNRLLGGCPALQFGTDETRQRFPYSFKGMRQLVLAYNRCRRPDVPAELIAPATGVRVRWGAKVGVNRTRFDYGTGTANGPAGPAGSAVGYQAGVVLATQSHSRFAVQLEATLLALRSTYNPVDVYTGTTLYSLAETTRVQFTQLQVPLLLCYRLGHGALQPFLKAGGFAGLNFSNASVVESQYSNRPSPQTYALPFPERVSLGYAAGAGLLVRRAARPDFSIELRFDQSVDASNASYIARHQSLRVEAGVFF